MTFGAMRILTQDIEITDPGADNKQFHFWKAPEYATVVAARIVVAADQGSGSAGEYTLHNYGTAGLAIKSGSAGTVIATLGGTAAGVRLGAGTPGTGTIVSPVVLEGEYLVLDYQETGDFVEERVFFQIDYIPGVATTS